MATIEFTTEELASEEWRPVVGWEGLYAVSNLGNVKSLNYRRSGRGQILRTASDRAGYLLVTLANPRKTRLVHVLVAEAFIGAKPLATDGYRIEVNHEDGIKSNCRAFNLVWTSHLQNMQHASRNGLMAIGEQCGASKLTKEMVVQIKIRLEAGDVQHAIAREFRVSGQSINAIANGLTWRHVSPHESP